MLRNAYLAWGALVCLTFVVGGARGWKPPTFGIGQMFHGTSGRGGGVGGHSVWFGGK